MINTTQNHGGRFANQFFVSMVLHYLAKKNNLRVSYKEYDNLTRLGIDLFTNGTNTYSETIKLTDKNFAELIKSTEPQNKNFLIENDSWFQTEWFSYYLKDKFLCENKESIINSNIFKERYNNNNDLFIHVRLDDIIGKSNETYEYYDKAISSVNFENGYISSDSINHDICLRLISKYNLKIINYGIVETIMFGSTAKNIILSGGTFSWLIGFFGFYSKILYPNFRRQWFGNIFVFDDWTRIYY